MSSFGELDAWRMEKWLFGPSNYVAWALADFRRGWNQIRDGLLERVKDLWFHLGPENVAHQ